jgi:ankyrin repeat protein
MAAKIEGMSFEYLPFRSPLDAYKAQAGELLAGHRSADPRAIQLFHSKHPRFLDEKIRWLPKNLADAEIAATTLDLGDAQLAVARWYDFADWPALAAWVAAVNVEGSPVCRFETAVEAVISGDLPALDRLLNQDSELVQARSTRVTHFDPPEHCATLLHYIGANGVEGYRQKTPANAVEITVALLKAGADPDATAGMYGGQCTTMSMLVSSGHPAQAGLQIPLIHTLVDFGASVEPLGEGAWRSPVMTALTFGFVDAAQALVQRGARVENLAAAAGLGRLDDARRLLAKSTAHDRHSGLSLAAQNGYPEIVALLLDAGEDANRYNPKANHPHTTPLHQAALGGHLDVVRLLVERGARLDIEDTIYHGTPLGWALHAGQTAVADYLRAQGAH